MNVSIPRYVRLKETWEASRRDLDAFVLNVGNLLKGLPRFELIDIEMQANKFPVNVKTGFSFPPRCVLITHAVNTSDPDGDYDVYALPRWRWADNGNVRLQGCTGLESGTATYRVTLLVIGS